MFGGGVGGVVKEGYPTYIAVDGRQRIANREDR